LDKFLDFLSDPEIDLINLKDNVITTDRVADIFAETMKSREEERERKKGKNGKDNFPDGKEEIPPGKDNFPPGFHPEIPTNKTKQDKTKTKQDINSSGSAEKEKPEAAPPGGDSNSHKPPSSPEKKEIPSQKPKKPPLKEREPVNDMERVEKAYLQNWDTLYSQGKVKTQDPIVNWNQTRKLLKRHFEKLKPDQIIAALKNGMADTFVMSGGYSLGIMLSAAVLNRLINARQGQGPPPTPGDKKSLEGLDSW
jgi:hypothetical protein